MDCSCCVTGHSTDNSAIRT